MSTALVTKYHFPTMLHLRAKSEAAHAIYFLAKGLDLIAKNDIEKARDFIFRAAIAGKAANLFAAADDQKRRLVWTFRVVGYKNASADQ